MKSKYNWINYKILVKGKFYPRDVEVSLTKSKPKSNKMIIRAVNQCWKDAIKGKMSVRQKLWDSRVYYLRSVRKEKGKIKVTLGETTYKYLQGTNATNWIIGDIFGKEYLANAILVQGLVQTKDNKIVLGRRTTGVKKKFEQFSIFGGTADISDGLIKDSNDLFRKMTLELQEEIGIREKDISEILLRYIVEDWKCYPVFIFLIKLNINSSDVANRFKKLNSIEHSDLVFLSKQEITKQTREKEESFTDLSLLAFDTLSESILSA